MNRFEIKKMKKKMKKTLIKHNNQCLWAVKGHV